MAKTAKHPNVNVQFYDGELELLFECPGRCKLASFFTDPPEADDECAFKRSYSCGHGAARLAAMKELQKLIGAEIDGATGEGDGEG